MTPKPTLTLKKKSNTPETLPLAADRLGEAKRLGKKVIYTVTKVVSISPQPQPILSKSGASPKKPAAPLPKKPKKVKQQLPTQEEIVAYRVEKEGRGVAWLIEHYPQLFTDSKKPLALGTHKKIRLLNPQTPRGLIAIGLTGWVSKPDYHEAVLISTVRYDLEGNPCGGVTEKEKVNARKQINLIQNSKA
jgi:ProP effector